MNPIVLWSMFYLGFAVNLLRQAQTSVSSASNSLDNVLDWLKLHWHVVIVRLFLSILFSPAVIKLMPASLGLPVWSVYGAAGFVTDNFLDSLLFMFGSKLNLKVEVPQIAPPKNGGAPSPPLDSPSPPAPPAPLVPKP